MLHKLLQKTTLLTTKLIKHILFFLIAGLRPLLGPAACKFEIGCTQYALEQLEQAPLYTAVWNITKRVLSCNPFTK